MWRHGLSIVAATNTRRGSYRHNPSLFGVWLSEADACSTSRVGGRKVTATAPTTSTRTSCSTAPTTSTTTSYSISGNSNSSSKISLIVYEHRENVSAFGSTTEPVYPRAYQRITDADQIGCGGPVWKEITTRREPEAMADDAQQLNTVVGSSKNKGNGLLLAARLDLLLSHFLPVGYPGTVALYYREYALHTFIASIAGSASMVLSTQSLLFAIGVVGTSTTATQAGILAGAINWVLKDGLSQAGAILWTSVSARNYDEHPKTWRMVAAIALDMAAAIELATPFLTETRGAVLVAACAAGTLKNIGFLTASASRAAMHQALTQHGRNLADVTAKAGSQSIVAGLLGTGLGLAASHILQGRPDILLCYSGCFIGLATIHQSFNYFAVRSIAFHRLDLPRACLVLDRFITDGTVLDPVQVSQQEPILFNTSAWWSQNAQLKIGVGIEYHPEATCTDDTRFLLSKNSNTVYVTFMTDASPQDQIVALYRALLLQKGRPECLPAPDLLHGLTNAQWDLQETDLEPRGGSIRISVDRCGS
jgi:hypothetical protein